MEKLDDLQVLQILENADVIRNIPPGGRAGHEQARRRLALACAGDYIEKLIFTFRPDLYDRYQELKTAYEAKQAAKKTTKKGGEATP